MYNVTVNGIVHRSLPEACRANNIKLSTIKYWLGLNFTREEAFEHVAAMAGAKEVTAFGETYSSLTVCCKAHNKCRQTVYCRIKRGQTLEQALS